MFNSDTKCYGNSALFVECRKSLSKGPQTRLSPFSLNKIKYFF